MTKQKSHHDLQSIIPIHGIGDGYAISKDGSITIGFKVSMPELDTLSLSDFTTQENSAGMNLNGVLNDAIKELEYEYIFHQQDIFYYDGLDLPSNSGYLSKSVNRLYNESYFLKAQSYIFITRHSSDFKNDEYNESAINKFTDNVNRFRIKLNQLSPVRMSSNDWIEYLTNFFSCSFSPNNNSPILDISFKDGMIGDYKLEGYHITGDKCIKEIRSTSLNSKQSNSYVKRHNSRIAPICWDIPCYKVVNNIIYRKNQDTLIRDAADFDSRMGFVSFGKGYSDAARNYKEIIEQKHDNGVLHNFNVFFMYLPQDEVMIKEKIEMAFERIKLRPSKVTHINKEFLFLSSIGGCVSRLDYPLYLHPSLIEEAVCFSNLENSYAQANKGIVLADMRGNPCIVDMFQEPFKKNLIANWNWIVIGPSGTGKSVTMNKIVSSLLMVDYFFFIIDNGNSYYNLCQMLGKEGRYIKLDSSGEQLSFNPFLLPMINPADDKERYLDPEIEIIKDTLFLAWDTDNFLGFKKDPNRSTYLSDLIFRFYAYRYENNLEYVNFTSFYDFVQTEYEKEKINTKYFDYDSFTLVMKKYISGQPLGFLFNGAVNFLDYNNLRMIVVELGELTERKDLYKIVLGMTMLLANRIIEHHHVAHKQFILDEAWALVAEEYFGDFLKYQYKTIRKKGGGMCVVVQEVNDLASSPHFEAITNGSETIALLSHETKESQVIDNQHKLSFTSEDVAMALSIKKADHAIFIRQGKRSKTYKVKLSPEELIVFSTTKSEKITFAQYIAQCGNNIQLATTQYCADKENNQTL